MMEQQAKLQNNEEKTKPGHWKGMKVISTVALALAMILCVVVISQVLSQGYVSVCGYSMFRDRKSVV